MTDETVSAQDEARRALETRIASSLDISTQHEVGRAKLWLTDVEMGIVLDALRADPARGAEEMRALPKSDFRQGRKVQRNVYHGDEPLFMAATDELASELVQILNAGAAAIRALPIPQDEQGGAK